MDTRQRSKRYMRKRRRGISFRWVLTALVTAGLLVGAFCLAYYKYQLPLFDRSGWHQGKAGAIQYWDYFGDPKTGWMEIDGKTYYLSPETGNAQVGWLSLDQKQYYFDQDGVMQTGWVKTEEGRYYLSEDGVVTAGWTDTPEGRFYMNEQGLVVENWQAADGIWSYRNADGSLYTGWMDIIGGKCYFDEKGIMQTGLVTINKSIYYFNEYGLMQTGWLELSGKEYYLREDGTACVGWLRNDEGVYYFDEAAARVLGWLSSEEGRFYLNEDGSQHTGFVEIDGVARYFNASGEYIPLINPWNPVPEDYELNLVTLEGHKLDMSCKDALAAMMKDCRADGISCVINSAYRNINTQTYLWNNRYNDFISKGYSAEEAKKLTWQKVAYPGTSEHHTGLAIDINGSDGMYQWIQEHSWEYGFIVRYPENKIDITGIMYEPWHIRYVGKETAEQIYQSGLCMEEFLEQQKAAQ